MNKGAGNMERKKNYENAKQNQNNTHQRVQFNSLLGNIHPVNTSTDP